MNILFAVNKETRFNTPNERTEADDFETRCALYIEASGHTGRSLTRFATVSIHGIAEVQAQFKWADMLWVFTDKGISASMIDAERRAERFNVTVQRKRLDV